MWWARHGWIVPLSISRFQGSKVPWFHGSKVSRFQGSTVSKFFARHRSEPWHRELWNPGTVEPCNLGTLEPWNLNCLKYAVWMARKSVRSPSLNIVMVSSEAHPFSKTGGLA